MTDGSTAVTAPVSATAAYARIYEEQQPRLVAYARSLTKNAWAAEDLVAEAHFRVWRRLASGHEIDNVPAYLMTTVRNLATAAGGAVRETPRDPQADERPEARTHGDDPAEQVSSVDLVVRVLGQLPERWVKALWLAEAEGQPLTAIGPQLGTKDGATAVLLHRAREGMRQAFLRAQTGAPDDPACQVHWARMPAYVRGAATERQSERLLGHVDACDDCRARLAALMRANDRLPALVGPALLVFAVGGAGKFLLAFTAGSAGAVTAAGGHGSGLLHGVRNAVGGGSKTPAVAAGAVVAGTAALMLVLGAIHGPSVSTGRTPVADAPVAQQPVAEAPVAPPAKDARAGAPERDGTPARTTAVESTAVAPSKTADGPGAAAPGPRDTDAPAPAGGTGGGDADAPSSPSKTPPDTDPDPTPPPTGGPEDGPEHPTPPAEDAPEPEAPGAEDPGAPEAEAPETDAPEAESPEPGGGCGESAAVPQHPEGARGTARPATTAPQQTDDTSRHSQRSASRHSQRSARA